MNKREGIQQEALKVALANERCTLGLSVGVGKTKVGIDYINQLWEKDLKVLVVSTLPIIETWKKELIKWQCEVLLDCITFSTYISLPKQDLDYDILIKDEVHMVSDSALPWLEQFKGRILGLTGTPPSNDLSIKKQIIDKYCPVLYTYLTDEAVDSHILNDYKITVHLLDLDKKKNIKVDKGGKVFYTSEEKTYDYWTCKIDNSIGKSKQVASIMRMKEMQSFKSKEIYGAKLFQEQRDKTIIFCNTQGQADRICNVSYHSKNPESEINLQLFSDGIYDKLSCVEQLSQGINIKELKVAIILHSYSSNSPKVQQRMGRILRLATTETAEVHILCYKDSIDEQWVKGSLEGFNQDKVQYYDTETKQFI